MGKQAKAPPAPDYIGAAKQTAESNLESARAAANANRVNQITPYGTLTYSQAPRQFNQAGYDEALRNYQSQLSAQQSAPQPTTQRINAQRQGDGRYSNSVDAVTQAYGQQPSAQTALKPPNREDFYIGSPDSGWTAEVKLDPAQQALLDQQNKTSLAMGGLQDQMIGQVKNAMGQQINYNDLPQVQGMDLSNLPQVQSMSLDNLPKINADYAKTGFDSIMSRLNPQLDQQRQAFNAQMAAQGINLGSEAYNNAFRNQSQSENDARTQAALQGIGIGLQQQQQEQALQNQAYNQRLGMFNSQLANRAQSLGEKQALFNSQLANQNQQYGLRTALQDRPLNQLNALRAGSQVTNPNFINPAQQATTGGVDYSGAAGLQNQYNMGLYNSQVAKNNGLMGGLFNLGTSAISGGLLGGLFK